MAEKIIYAISDSLGETAEAVARATASQYDKEQIEIVRIPYIDSESQIDENRRRCKTRSSRYLSYYRVRVLSQISS